MKSMQHIFLAGWLALLGVFALPAQAGSDTPDAIVIIKGMKFQPREITVHKGAVVRWENREKRQYHSVWFEEAGDPEPDYFFPGEYYERKFDKVGVFPYRCGPHPEMTGVVKVIE